MARAIDGDELLGIERLLDTDVVRQSKTASWLLDQVLHDIQAIPTLTPPNEWVRVEEMLPEEKQRVIVRCERVGTSVGWILWGNWMTDIGPDAGKVTHWMPLPERPKEDAAAALSMLQAENAQLRGELEYEQEHANAYHEECGQWEAENEKLRSDLRRLQTERDTLLAANQHLLAEREQLTAERDAAVSDIENALAYGLKDCELCVNVQCYVRGGTKPCLPKWRGPKKED